VIGSTPVGILPAWPDFLCGKRDSLTKQSHDSLDRCQLLLRAPRLADLHSFILNALAVTGLLADPGYPDELL